MASFSRSRRGTSPSFWRNHNGQQLMMVQACMPSVRLSRAQSSIAFLFLKRSSRHLSNLARSLS
jgi:hypothetical protein